MSAPHSSGGWHCHDDNDLMCYWDGGSYFQHGGQMTYPCTTTPDVWMDCGRDDYYYPGTPPAGHYLATHWNTARSGFLTLLAPDTAPPTVVRRDPASAARAVDRATYVSVKFSEGVRGVSGTTFTLKNAAGTAVAATVTYDASVRRATLDPTTLAADVRYTVTLTGGSTAIRDRANNPLATTSWSFTTGPRPTVTARAPASAATAVSRAANTTATFSEAVLGVSGTTFTLRNPGGTMVPAVVTYDATTRTATLNPSSDLAPDTRYTATLTGGTAAVRDRAGNPLTTTSWSFTTGPRPTVTARTPASGATGVSRTANVTATFSEAVRGTSTSTVTLRAGTSAAVSAVVTYDSATRRVTLNPSVTLVARTVYTARLVGGTSAIRDLAGNPLTTTSWSFTTGA